MNETIVAPRFVLTGMSGTGKTALIRRLRNRGNVCFDEPARKILEARITEEGAGFAPSFIREMLRQSVEDFHAAGATVAPVFYDRGIPDVIAYAVRFGVPTDDCRRAAETCRYGDPVFLAPPWPEIFEHDEYRRAPYDDYIAFHGLLQRTYRELGYTIVELPKVPVDERVEFIEAAAAAIVSAGSRGRPLYP